MTDIKDLLAVGAIAPAINAWGANDRRKAEVEATIAGFVERHGAWVAGPPVDTRETPAYQIIWNLYTNTATCRLTFYPYRGEHHLEAAVYIEDLRTCHYYPECTCNEDADDDDMIEDECPSCRWGSDYCSTHSTYH